MNAVLLLARDPLASGDGHRPFALAARLAADHDVRLVLLEGAVVAARPGPHGVRVALDGALGAGVELLVDDDAAAARGIDVTAAGGKPVAPGDVIDLLMEWADRQVWL